MEITPFRQHRYAIQFHTHDSTSALPSDVTSCLPVSCAAKAAPTVKRGIPKSCRTEAMPIPAGPPPTITQS